MNNDLLEPVLLQEEDFIKISNNKVGAVFLGRILHFGLNFKRSLILLRRLKTKVDKIINLISYALAIAGILSLVFWLYLNLELINYRPEELLLFYKSDHPLILAFFISLIFVMFIIYRVSEKKASLERIKKIKEKKNNQKSDYRQMSKVDVYGSLSDDFLLILENAYLLANKLRQKEVSTIHLFWCLLYSPKISNLFVRLNVDINKLTDLLKKYLATDKRLVGTAS